MLKKSLGKSFVTKKYVWNVIISSFHFIAQLKCVNPLTLRNICQPKKKDTVYFFIIINSSELVSLGSFVKKHFNLYFV